MNNNNSTNTKQSTTTVTTTEESGEWVRGAIFLQCASTATKFDQENEMNAKVPSVVINNLQTNIDCGIKKKNKLK